MADLQTVAPGETNILRIVNCLRGLVGYVQAAFPASSVAGDVAVFADTTGSVLKDGGSLAAFQQALLAGLQGKFEFVNDANDSAHVNMALIPFNGNNMVIWNTVTNQWVNFAIPANVAITGVVSNGSGKCRVTHAATSRPFVVGQQLAILNVVGTTEINDATGAVTITAVNAGANTFDLSTNFTNAYVSGGSIQGWIVARADNVTLNGVANQALSIGTAYTVGVKFLDAACTVATLVADTGLSGYNPEPTMGFNVLQNVAYGTLVPLVGMVYNDATLGVQGNGSSELLISWYNRSFFGANQQYNGNTGGTTGSFVALSNTNPTGAGGVLKWLNWSDLSPDISAVFSISGTVAADMILKIAVTGTNTFSAQQGFHYSGSGIMQVSIIIPVAAQNAGFNSLAVSLQTSAGTATSGAAFNSTVRVWTNF